MDSLMWIAFGAGFVFGLRAGYSWGGWVGRGEKAMKIPHRGSTSEKQ